MTELLVELSSNTENKTKTMAMKHLINWFETTALEPCTINALTKVGSEDRDQSEII